MGQRHQLFVIAKVGGRYRNLAAVYHQWLYGRTAIRQALKILKICHSPRNLPKLRQDLARAGRIDFDALPKSQGAWDPIPNFQFIATCLVVGASLDDEDNYTARADLISSHLTPDDLDNDDGITVFDITDPANARYCFTYFELDEHERLFDERAENATADEIDEMFMNEDELKSCDDASTCGYLHIDKHDILDASKYIRIYYDEQKQEEMDASDIVAECDSYPLVTADALNSLWAGDWIDKSPQAEDDHFNVQSTSNLRDQSISRIIDEALNSPSDDLTWMQEAEQFHDFLPRLRARLVEAPGLLRKPSGLDLLRRALATSDEVDLTFFDDLQLTDVHKLLTQLRGNEPHRKQRSLYLPYLPKLRAEDIKTFVDAGNVRALHLADTDDVDLQTIMNVAGSAALKSFTHPDLYRRAFEPIRNNAQNTMSSDKKTKPNEYTSNRLVQMVYIRHFLYADTVRLERQDGIAWSQTQTESEYGDMFNTMTYEVPSVFCFPLQDAILMAEDVVRRIPGALKRLLLIDQCDCHMALMRGTQAIGVAKQLAIGKDDEILPTPREAFVQYTRHASRSPSASPGFQELRAGEWTLLALHEQPMRQLEGFPRMAGSSKLRYAFLTLGEEDQPRVVDATAFFEAVTDESTSAEPLKEAWKTAIHDLEDAMMKDKADDSNVEPATVGTSGEEEVKEALKLLGVFNDQLKKYDSNGERIWDYAA